jgi:hypothetical protein
MKVEISKLKTFTNYGKMKGISRQRIHILVNAQRFDTIEIDGIKFIVMNEKALKYEKQFPR